MPLLAKLFGTKQKVETRLAVGGRPPGLVRHRDVLTEVESKIAMGHYAEAFRICRRAGEATPSDARVLLAVTRAFQAWGRVIEAAAFIERVQASGAQDKQSHVIAASVYRDLGRFDEAEKWIHRAMEGDDDEDVACQRVLVFVLIAKKSFVEAARICEHALLHAPEDAELLNMLGAAHFGSSNFSTASRAFRLAVQANPKSNEAWTNLGLSLRSVGKQAEGLDALVEAERLGYGNDTFSAPDSFANLATALKDDGRNEEALAIYMRNLPRRPSVSAHCDYALNLLRVGQFSEGWKQYEFRWLQSAHTIPRPNISWPAWNGQNLQGRTVLLRAEQGFGDTLQFIRFAPLVKALGARVLLRVQTELEPLLKNVAGVDALIPTGEPFPAFDFYVHLMSLPRVLGINDVAKFGREPYIKADSARVSRWAERFADKTKLKVGLTWAGNPAHLRDFERSTSLRALLPLLQTTGVQFVSLQKGQPGKEIGRLPKEIELLDVASELHDFAETAAALTQLDLLISVDTSIVHLAGAMGLPVWLLSRKPPDWRWRDGRSDCDCYPSLAHYEQQERGNWAELVNRVTTDLGQWVHERAMMGSGVLKVGAHSGHSAGAMPALAVSMPKLDDERLSAVVEGRSGIFQYFPDEPLIGVSLERYGEWLQPQLDMLSRILRVGATVIEAGAGVGAHSVALSRIVGTDGHLMLYEAEPLMRRVLRQNVECNRLANVTVMRRSLGASEASSLSTVAGSESVDDLALDQLDCLKINASADALVVLAQAGDTLWRTRPLIFVQAPDPPVIRSISELIGGYAYRCWQLDTSLFHAANFQVCADNVFGEKTATALLAIPEEREVSAVPSGLYEIS